MVTVNHLQAWLKLVQMEREEAEKERKKEEEERRKRKEEAKRRSRILEAAFDGDNDEILSVLDEVKYHLDQREHTVLLSRKRVNIGMSPLLSSLT